MMTDYATYKAVLKATGKTSMYDLADAIGVSQHAVWAWFNRGRFSVEGALAIERLSKGKIKAGELLKLGRE